MIRVVLDTNVLVSAICLPSSLPGELLRRAIDRQYQLILSESICDELNNVLNRPKIVNSYGMTSLRINAFMETLALTAEVAAVAKPIDFVVSDPKDNHIVACALRLTSQNSTAPKRAK